MATVVAPLHSSEARGRVGGLIYNTFRGIATVKSKTGPAQPRTQKQLLVRAFGIQLARAWQALSDAYRGEWNDYATTHTDISWTGNPKRLTGLNWFLRLNSRLLQWIGTTIDEPPAVAAPDPLADMAATGGAGQIVINWTDTSLANGKVSIWLSGPHSAGQVPRFPKAKWNHLASMAAATYTITDLLAGTYDVWVTAFDPATGLISTYTLDSTVVS